MIEPVYDDAGNRTFTVGQVLTIAVGDLDAHQLFCPYAEFLDIVGYLLADVPSLDGDPNADPPIPPMVEVVEQRCRPAVLDQHPELATVDPPAVLASNTAVLSWLAAQEAAHGERLALRPVVTREEFAIADAEAAEAREGPQ